MSENECFKQKLLQREETVDLHQKKEMMKNINVLEV